MDPVILARVSDPATSHEAARKTVTRTALVRLSVLAILEEYGPVTHDRLNYVYRCREYDGDVPRASDSSIRTRCAELVRAGLVVEAGRGVSRMGNPATLWAAVKP